MVLMASVWEEEIREKGDVPSGRHLFTSGTWIFPAPGHDQCGAQCLRIRSSRVFSRIPLSQLRFEPNDNPSLLIPHMLSTYNSSPVCSSRIPSRCETTAIGVACTPIHQSELPLPSRAKALKPRYGPARSIRPGSLPAGSWPSSKRASMEAGSEVLIS